MNKEAFKTFVEASGLSEKDQNLVKGVMYDYLGSVATPAPQSGIGRYGEMGRQFPYEDELRRLEDQQMKSDFDKANNKDYKGANNEPEVHNISEFTVGRAPQSADVMTLEDDEQSLQQIKEWVWDWHVERGLQGCGSGMDFDDIFHAINSYSLPIKAKSDQLQAELSEYKSGLKQCQADRDELHKELEQVKEKLSSLKEILTKPDFWPY